MVRALMLLTALAGALLLAWQGTVTPPPMGADAPATAFSAGRAMADIRQIAREPHPIGSPANARVRDLLLARMAALGLSPEVQTARAFETRPWRGDSWTVGATVQNLVGVLPGRDRTLPALALMAHYDSVPASPGAADDATGVAATLETIRAIRARGVPARDIIVLFTDGEEAGLLGARAFFEQHPLRRRVGLLINTEARGGGGRANMFQTGPDNGAIVAAFARTAVTPVSNSLAVFLYENMPNDTDFTVSKAAGVNGLNFAFIGRQFDYHSPTSTADNLDQGSVQHMGDQVLAATADLAFAPALPGKAPDAVYSQTFGSTVLSYPAWAGWIVLLAAAGLLATAVSGARRSADLRAPDLARGAGAALFVLIAGALLFHLARRLTGVDFGFLEQRPLLARWSLWETALAGLGLGILMLVPPLLARGGARRALAATTLLAGVLCQAVDGWDPVGLALGVAGAAIAFLAFGRAVARPAAWLGVQLTALAAGLVLQALLPAVAFLVVWPLLLACVGAAATTLGLRVRLPHLAVLALLAALGGGWLAAMFHTVAQGLDLPDILALFLWLGALLIWPLAAPDRPWRVALAPAAALLVAGLALTLYARMSEPWTPRHPRVTSVFHVTDLTRGETLRVSTAPGDLDAWSRRVLIADGGAVGRRDLPPLTRSPAWAALARPVAAPPASIRLARDTAGRIILRATPPPGARILTLDLKATTPMTAVSLDGRPATMLGKAGQPARLRWLATPEGIELVLTPRASGALEVRHASVSEGWPADAAPLPRRPADAMAFDLSDSTVVIGASRFSW